jgi:selenocysteine lyase/cysteine desulfurase
MDEQDYRSQFPVARDWAYLNHAAVAPISLPARNRVHEWADDMASSGNVNEAAWYSEIEDVRRLSAELIAARPEEVALLKNTSEGISLVAEGWDWQPGESVVTVEGEFPANVYPWLHLESKGVAVRRVPTREQGRIAIDDLAGAIDESTRILAISHVQYASGFRSDLRAIGGLCRERGVRFCVDAIQGLGVIPIDVEEMYIDFLAADGHKWLLSPEGAAIFFCRRELLDRLRPISVGWKSVANYANHAQIDFRYPDSASRFECGSMNVPSIVGLGASLKLLSEIGIETISSRVRDITDHLVSELERIGADVFSPRGEGEWSGIISFELPRCEPRRAKKHCLERQVVLSYRAGRLRASPHFYNNQADTAALIDALQSAPRL